jgi:two-component system, NtrC family, nitrogen regulation sensor histidine kinase NtrY
MRHEHGMPLIGNMTQPCCICASHLSFPSTLLDKALGRQVCAALEFCREVLVGGYGGGFNPGRAMMPTEEASMGVIGPIAVVAALLSALTTFLVLAKLTFVSSTSNVVVTLLAVNFITVLLLLAIIGREFWHIIQVRKRGARLHVQITVMFSVVGVVPVVLVATVASVNLNRWIESSAIVSQAYLKQHELSIQAETNFMASDVAKAKSLFGQDIDRFRQGFTTQARLRGMPVAIMLRSDQSVILKADIRIPSQVQEPPLPPADRLAQIGESEAVAGWLGDTDYVDALIKLKGYDNAYLFAARLIDPRVLEQVRLTEMRIGVQVASALMYAIIALTVLLLAVRIGFGLANRLAPAEIA